MEDLNKKDSPWGEIKTNVVTSQMASTKGKSRINLFLVLPVIVVMAVVVSSVIYFGNKNQSYAKENTPNSSSSSIASVASSTESTTSSVSSVNSDVYTSKKLGISFNKLTGSKVFPSKVEELSQLAVPFTSSTTKLSVPVLNVTNANTWVQIIKYDTKYSYEEYFKWSKTAEASVIGEVYPVSNVIGTIKKGLSMSYVGDGSNGYKSETASPKHVVYYNEVGTDSKSTANKTYLMKVGNNKYIVRVFVNDANDETIATDTVISKFDSAKKANVDKYMKTLEEKLKEAEVVVNSIKAI
jgi:hypothetical protein